MRHNVKRSGLRKTKGWYKALRKNLITQLFKYDKIKTTLGRARTITPIVEKVISNIVGKEEREAVRYLQTYITEEVVAKKIIQDVKDKKYTGRNSGFVSVVRIGVRGGDAAPLVQIELNK
jgi:large subunit ribosomal protein L17